MTIEPEEEFPLDDTPEYCHKCGADSSYLVYDLTDGWCCLACGGTDADE